MLPSSSSMKRLQGFAAPLSSDDGSPRPGVDDLPLGSAPAPDAPNSRASGAPQFPQLGLLPAPERRQRGDSCSSGERGHLGGFIVIIFFK